MPLDGFRGISNGLIAEPKKAKGTLTIYDVASRGDGGRREWVWHPGAYKVHAGRSSRDLRLSTEVVLR